MKKILIITNLPSPYRVRFFDKLGEKADVTVLYYNRAEEDAERNAAWFENGAGSHKAVTLNWRITFGKGKFLCADVKDWLVKPWDEIVVCGYSDLTVMYAIWYLRRKKIRFWLEVDGGLIRENSGPKYRLKKSLICGANGWFSSGKVTTEFLVHYGARQEQVYTYPFSSLTQEDILPMPVSEEEKRALRKSLGIPGKRMVLSVGQFVPRKGMDTLIQAAAKLEKDTTVCIVGGQPPEEYLALQNRVGADNVMFVDFQKREALARYYRAADVFALATREDIWGLVINEAMAYGLPVVTTNRCVAGMELVQDGQNGYVIPIEDSAILAEKIIAVLQSDLVQMGEASLKAIRGYTIEAMAQAHEAAWNF